MQRFTHHRAHRALFVMLIAGAFGAGVSAAHAQTAPPGADTAHPVAPVQNGVTEPPRPGDVVRVRIWREPDLSGDFAIEETGIVVLPRIGPVLAAAETAESLREKVTAEYEEFLPHTSISVTLLRRVQILGAVRNPGLYPVDPTMTLSDALALAGGSTAQGKAQAVELIRGGERIATRLNVHTTIANSPLRSGDQIYVPERSWISRNAGVVSAALTATVSVVIALMR
jgi:protein involved in polysaccharide export with SLBB domain